MTWPEDRAPAAEVREWIRSQAPDCEEVDGPTVVYRVNDWSLTARFAVKRSVPTADTASAGRDSSVVCKIAFSPEDATAPLVYRVLQACGAGHVPELLAWKARGSQTWLLFAAFEGQVIRDLGAIAPVAEMARTLARIQCGVAALPASETAGILRLPVEQVPSHFEEILRRIREEGLCFTEGEPLVPHQERAAFRDDVAGWAGELSTRGWPESIDHPDLHTNNAVLLESGPVLICDWEGATLGCPFLSMDNLLENAGRLDKGPGALLHIRQQSGLAYTPSQIAVRRAYLEELPWGTPAARERAFDLAMCLSPVHCAYQHLTFFASLGRDYLASPEGGIEKHSMIAEFLKKALRQWSILLQRDVS